MFGPLESALSEALAELDVFGAPSNARIAPLAAAAAGAALLGIRRRRFGTEA
ncbi:hypothetical protein [Plantibacter sp. YIM 135347]|uniref:hypothetical protein n=1 Tax=Plantibacter sp. YIM 135347 TaxID=3423919 RepID=UPI003D3278AA